MFVANYVRASQQPRTALPGTEQHSISFPVYRSREKVVDYLGRICLSLIDSEVETPPLEIEYHNGASYASVRLNPFREGLVPSIPLSPDEAMQLLLGLVLRLHSPSSTVMGLEYCGCFP